MDQDSWSVEPLIDYLQDPNPSSILCIIANKANKGRRLYQAMAKAGRIIEFAMPSGTGEWQEWIGAEARANGKTIGMQAASYLAEWSGHHTGILGAEIEKLAVYLGDRQEIMKEDIGAVCIPMAETTVFKMLDGIAARNAGEALQRLREVVEREHYLKVNTMIVRQVRLLLTACYLRTGGGSPRNW